MAYVASWIAPAGSVVGAKNWEQKPRNADNINQTFVKNETEGKRFSLFCWIFISWLGEDFYGRTEGME